MPTKKPIYKFHDEEGNDVVEILYRNLASGKDKDHSINIAGWLDIQILDREMDEEFKQTISHIVAMAQIWEGGESLNPVICRNFLESGWAKQYPEQIETLLVMLYALEEKPVIDEFLDNFPWLKDDFAELHQAYLAAIVYPESEKYYKDEHFHLYNKFNKMKQLLG